MNVLIVNTLWFLSEKVQKDTMATIAIYITERHVTREW